MSFKEIIAVYTENDTKSTIKNAAELSIKAGGTHSYRSALKG
jgi:hypothetical protein